MMTQTSNDPRPDFLGRHYTLGELAKAWHMSRLKLRGYFIADPRVIKWGYETLKEGRQRTHVTLRIPEYVAREVYALLTGNSGNW